MSNRILAGRYELIEKIGDGGMAVVYKAKDKLLNRYVAVKILRPEFTNDEQFIINFKKESQAAAGLQHPNIVGVYDVGKEGSIYYIVMELIDGRPLSDIIEDQAPLDYKQVVEIGKQVAAALSLAHKNNIVHRDVKPHNIMITKDGTAKLADFGIARAITNATFVNNSENNRVMGSVHYFSPEQARGKYVDEKSDVYSLGIVLYEMLTGKVPFDGDDAVQIALKHINDEITPPSNLVSGVPPALEKIVMKATDKYQNNRYNNAEEIFEELSGVDFLSKKVGDAVLLGGKRSPKKINDEEEILQDLVKETSKKRKKKNKDGESGKGKKVLIIAACIIGFIVIAGGAYAIASTLFGNSGADVKVPDVTNMTYEEAKTTLTDAKLKIKKGDYRPSAEVEKDKIVSQTPLSGKTVKEGTTVTVNISKGKESGVIPSLVGKKYNYDEIKSLLEQYGFKLGEVTKEENDDFDADVISSQSPGEGLTAKEGTKVSIVVSTGSKKSKVPTLTGITLDEAQKAISSAGFTLGTVTYEENNIYAAGYVIWQEHPAGEELKKGSSISIKVSKAKNSNNSDSNNTSPGGNKPEGGESSNDGNANSGE